MPETSAEIVAVGSELLLGEHVDTNSAWISSRLAEVGVDVYRHTTVGDNVGRMVDALRQACGRARTVIVTGGLGPTADDLTRVAVARLANVELHRHAEIVAYLREHFRRGGRQMPASNLLQADIPAGAVVLQPVGTAPGFAIDIDGSTVWCVPGVPSEMRVMVQRDVIPRLQRLGAAAATVSRVVRTSGMAESAVDEACAAVTRRLEATGNPTLAFLASRGETRVRLTAKAPDRHAALALLAPLVDELLELLGPAVVGLDDEGVQEAVARQLRRLRLTLAVAESITGGGVGARLVTVAGASDWFAGGLVTYATEAKTRLADVSPSLLEAFGPVSQQTAVALAEGARARLEADVGLAVVGVAGPTTQGGQPVGLTWVATALPDGSSRATNRRLPARSRPDVQEFAVSMALDFLRRQLAELA
ncbi:MAG: competence/damage-inducible protein A [Actinomycetota bacterium]|nr:competence/damage-inducible protein A [Actinomycetota bacterium]